MQNFNYHTHTKRCNHAIGNDEDYVIKAIQSGIKVLGFSDHCPYKGSYNNEDRMDPEELTEYYQSIRNLKKKYATQIDIRLSLECEYYPSKINEYKQYLSDCDYLVLGQHYSDLNGIDFYLTCNDQELLIYTDLIIQGLNTGMYKYLAHIDYFMITRNTFNQTCIDSVYRIAKACFENDVVVEINLKGYCKEPSIIDGVLTWPYPLHETFKIISEVGCKCVFGLDCHDPEQFLYMDKYIVEVKEYLKDLNLNIIDDLYL